MRLENEIDKMNLSGSGKQKSFFRKFLPDSARAFQILHSRTAREQERPKDWAQKNGRHPPIMPRRRVRTTNRTNDTNAVRRTERSGTEK
jgi:hypothetical protein